MTKGILFHKLPPRSMESVREGLSYFLKNHKHVLMNNFRKIYEGESLKHPRFIEVLEMIRKDFPDAPIDIKTNGTQLTKDYIKKIAKYNPIGIEISYMANDAKTFAKILGVSPKHYQTVRNSFKIMKDYEIEVSARITPVLSLNGWDGLEEMVKFVTQYDNDIMVNYMTYNRFANKKLIEFLKMDYDETYEHTQKWSKKYDANIYVSPDLYEPLDLRPRLVMIKTVMKRYKNVLWMLSNGAFERGKKIIDECSKQFPNNHYPICVEPHFLGGNIVSCGLTMVEDYIRALSKVSFPYDLILIPASGIDKSGHDMKNDHIDMLSKLGKDYWIIIDREDYLTPDYFTKDHENKYYQSVRDSLSLL
jgi:hypothetical protein